MVERMPRGMGSRCGVKMISLRIDADLLQQFAGVAMREDAVGGEIVGRIHEMRLGGGRFARAAHAALRIGNDAVRRDRQARPPPAASARG